MTDDPDLLALGQLVDVEVTMFRLGNENLVSVDTGNTVVWAGVVAQFVTGHVLSCKSAHESLISHFGAWKYGFVLTEAGHEIV